MERIRSEQADDRASTPHGSHSTRSRTGFQGLGIPLLRWWWRTGDMVWGCRHGGEVPTAQLRGVFPKCKEGESRSPTILEARAEDRGYGGEMGWWGR